MALLIFYLTLAIAFSFLCSILEAVVLSTSASYLQTKISDGSKSAKNLKKLKENIDRPLSAILSINTIAHTIGAAGVGAQAAIVFENIGFGVISAVLTILILVFSEIIPKTIGALYWRKLALPSANVLQIMIIVAYPLVIISEFITKIISGKKQHATVSRKEVAAMADLGVKEGVFEKSESQIINNLLKLKNLHVRSIMTPRTVVVAAPEETILLEFFQNKEYLKYSRIPIFQGNKDNITGYVLKYDILEKLANDEFELKLIDIKRPIKIIYENVTIPKLFESLISSKEHIAIIVDEYGGLEGIVTMEDVFETLLGLEILDETDTHEDMQKVAKEKWEKRAKEMNSNLDLREK